MEIVDKLLTRENVGVDGIEPPAARV